MTIPFRVYFTDGIQVSLAAVSRKDAIGQAEQGHRGEVERVTYLDGFREIEAPK